MKRAWPWLVIVLSAAVVVEAQTSRKGGPEPTPRPIGGLSFADEVDVTVVNIDVYVRDKKGRPVTDLKQEDFRVSQDGTERAISNFAILTQELFQEVFAFRPEDLLEPTPAVPEEGLTREEIRPIFTVIYVDNENINPLRRNRVLRQVRDFVGQNLHEPMQTMVVSYQKSLKVTQPFTSDAHAVNAALRSLTTYTGGFPERESTRRDIRTRLHDEHTERGMDQRSGFGSRDWEYSRVAREILAYAEEEAYLLTETLAAIRQVVDMLAGVDGRKSIIYVSDGLAMVPGAGLLHEYASVYHDNSILTQRGRFDRTRLFKSLVDGANGLEVSFYTIDAQGLRVHDGISAEGRYSMDPLASSISSSNYQDSLRYMAQQTGGLAIVNTNDIAAGLERIRDDLFTYYSLGYTLSSSGADKIHRIEVELPGYPEYDLRYRRRFVEKSLESRVQDKVMTGLIVEFTENPMELEVFTGEAAPAAGERWTVPIRVNFPLKNLALIAEREDYVGRLVLFVAARDNEGSESELQRQEHEVRVPAADYERAQGEYFSLDVQLLMREGNQRVAIGIMDQVTRQASFERIALNVP